MHETPAHIQVGPVDGAPELVCLTVKMATNGYPFAAFTCNREELMRRLNPTPENSPEQLGLAITFKENKATPMLGMILG